VELIRQLRVLADQRDEARSELVRRLIQIDSTTDRIAVLVERLSALPVDAP
jgi:hypothetical protein